MFLGIGLLSVVVMLFTMDVSEVDLTLVQRLLPIWLPSLIALWALNYLIHTFALRLIIGGEKRVPFARLYGIVLSGFALNHVTPAGLVGGEPFRIMALKGYVGVEHAASSSLLFSFMQTLSHMLLFVVSSALYFIRFGTSGGAVLSSLWAIVFLLTATLSAVALTSRKNGVVSWFFRQSARLPLVGKRCAAFAEKNREAFLNIDRDFVAFRRERGRFLLALLLNCLTRALEVLEYFCIFRILNAPLSFFDAAIAYACASLFGLIAFFMPMQIGSREGGLAFALSWFSEPALLGLTASLLARVREIFYILLGLILIPACSRGAAKHPTDARVSETGNETAMGE